MDEALADRIEVVIWNTVKAGLREDVDRGQYRVNVMDAVAALLAGWGPTAARPDPTLACLGECFGPKNTPDTWAEMVQGLRTDLAAHEACIQRLWGEGWGVHCEPDGWLWVKDGHREPMTAGEQTVMSRCATERTHRCPDPALGKRPEEFPDSTENSERPEPLERVVARLRWMAARFPGVYPDPNPFPIFHLFKRSSR